MDGVRTDRIAIVQTLREQAETEVNAFEQQIVDAEDDASDALLWEQAEKVVNWRKQGLTQRDIARTWVNVRESQKQGKVIYYSHVHVLRVERVLGTYKYQLPRPRFRACYNIVCNAEPVEQPKPDVIFPPGTFPVIYADPPWAYDNSGFTQSAASVYPTLPIEEICEFTDSSHRPVTDLFAPGSVLFLWATSPLLDQAFAVMAAWEFQHKASMVWRKDRAPGIGWWVQTYHELLLIGVREQTPQPAIKPASVIDAPVSNHSAKPAKFAETIEQMFPGPLDGTHYVELFCRSPRQGWAAFGNEIPEAQKGDTDGRPD